MSAIDLNGMFYLGEKVRYRSPYSYMQVGYMSNGAIRVERVAQPCEVTGKVTAVKISDHNWVANALVGVPIINPAANDGTSISERKDIVAITEDNRKKFKKE